MLDGLWTGNQPLPFREILLRCFKIITLRYIKLANKRIVGAKQICRVGLFQPRHRQFHIGLTGGDKHIAEVDILHFHLNRQLVLALKLQQMRPAGRLWRQSQLPAAVCIGCDGAGSGVIQADCDLFTRCGITPQRQRLVTL